MASTIQGRRIPPIHAEDEGVVTLLIAMVTRAQRDIERARQHGPLATPAEQKDAHSAHSFLQELRCWAKGEDA
jgi:hypothetical protein